MVELRVTLTEEEYAWAVEMMRALGKPSHDILLRHCLYLGAFQAQIGKLPPHLFALRPSSSPARRRYSLFTSFEEPHELDPTAPWFGY